MTPRQLEKAANIILATAGFSEPDLGVSFLEPTGISEQADVELYEILGKNADEPLDDDKLISDAFASSLDQFKEEYLGYQSQRRAAAQDVNRLYVGHTDPSDEELYTDLGMHITDRP